MMILCRRRPLLDLWESRHGQYSSTRSDFPRILIQNKFAFNVFSDGFFFFFLMVANQVNCILSNSRWS